MLLGVADAKLAAQPAQGLAAEAAAAAGKEDEQEEKDEQEEGAMDEDLLPEAVVAAMAKRSRCVLFPNSECLALEPTGKVTSLAIPASKQPKQCWYPAIHQMKQA